MSASDSAVAVSSAVPPGGNGMPLAIARSSNRPRSVAESMMFGVVPSIWSVKPAAPSDCDRLMAVCPPNCTATLGGNSGSLDTAFRDSPSCSDGGVSLSITLRTLSSSSGSK